MPHAGCSCSRCERFRAAPLHPACLGVVGRDGCYLIDATPAIGEQMRMLPTFPRAILLTHTHMGHIAGLLQLGEEACDSKHVEVSGTPLVCELLENNEPWRRLVKRGNIHLNYENAGTRLDIEDELSFESFPVEHRDVETVGWFVRGPERTLLYLPDIDDWKGLDLAGLIDRCDLALLDGTFYSADELPRLKKVPHPPVARTLDLLDPERAAKVRFFHLNHTNPLLDEEGPVAPVAVQGDAIPL